MRQGRQVAPLSLRHGSGDQFVPAGFAAYVLLNLLRALVTVKVPSCCADTLIQNAGPLCAGGGGVFGPGAGAATGATGIAAGAASVRLAMNMPGTVYSWPPSSEKWICHRFSRPGDDRIIRITSGWAPLRVPLLTMATRGRTACMMTSEVDVLTA